MLLVDATTAEHARGIRTVIAGVVGALAECPTEDVCVVAGPELSLPPSLAARRVGMARSRPGRLLYQRALLPLDVAVQRRHGNAIDRVLLLDAYAPLIRPNRGLRYAALVHDVLPLTDPHYWSYSKRLVKRAAFASIRRGVSLVTSSEFNAEQIEGVLGIRARVVRFGCGQLTDAEADAALTEPLPVRDPYLLYVGAFEPRKGLPLLLDAFARFSDAFDRQTRLVLAGGGSLSNTRSLLAAVARSPARDLIQVVSNPDRERSIELIREASAVVLPSHAEGFGLPAIEAMALGTPVIVRDIPAFRSWADGAAQFASAAPEEWLPPIAEAIAATDERRRSLQEFARAYRWSSCVTELVAF